MSRRPENNERTRFLSDAEISRLLEACKEDSWQRLYLLVLMARQLQMTKRYSHLATSHKAALVHRVMGKLA